MKLMIASDLHGSAYYVEKLLEAFDREQADKLLLLGDLLYHGPRNDLPKDYAPKRVLAMLNERKDVLLCVRGNCDAEVDQMVLDFPVLAEYAVLYMDGITAYAVHGHKEPQLPLRPGDLRLSGHTHVPVLEQGPDGVYYANPGSVSMPKCDSCHGYMTLTDGVLRHIALEDGPVLPALTIKSHPTF